MSRTSRFIPGHGFLIAAAMWFAPAAYAQAPTPRAGVPAPSTDVSTATRDWRVRPLVSAESEYDDNIFRLRSSRKDNLDSPAAASLASGRYANMKSASDLVTTLRAVASIEGRGLGGRKLSISPELAYEMYAINAERRNLTVSVDVEQALRRGGRARLKARSQPEVFGRNYLVDAVDRDGSGTIDPAERVYRAGVYTENELALDYRFRLNKSTKRSPFGAALQLEAGYKQKAYEAPFAGRDVDGPAAGATLLMALTPRLSLDLGYEFAALGASPSVQVLLVDEPDFGVDFNANGTAAEEDVRVEESVDRSHRENRIRAKARLEVGRRTDLGIGYSRRLRSFTSDEPFDVSYRGRRDTLDELEAGLRIRVTHQLRLVAGGSLASQRLKRDSDGGAAGETADYDRLRLKVGLAYGF